MQQKWTKHLDYLTENVGKKQLSEMALELGATHVIDPAAGDVGQAIRAILPDGVDFAFETSGREQVVETALASLRAESGLLGVVTRSEKGCVVANGASAVAAPAFPVEEVVDTTGAGDPFT